MTALTDQTAEAARFLSHYAKQHAAGAFATPTARELEGLPVHEWRDGDDRMVAVERTTRAWSTRTDFTGAPIRLAPGTDVLTHVAATPHMPVPDLSGWERVFVYATDLNLRAGLLAQGREVVGVQVTAASEIIECWGMPGERRRYPLHDLATITPVTVPLSKGARDRLVEAAKYVTGWHDDFPYYSDGSWSAISLRGFSNDPRVGVKPAEMGRKWQAEHPEMLDAAVRWTSLSKGLPEIRAFVESVPWWRKVERVRLLRMAGMTHAPTSVPSKPHVLRRHSDITDRAAGLADGQIARFHLPLITHPDVTMTAWEIDGSVRTEHLEAARCYYLDARKPHAVTNPTDVDRVHLVVDVVVDERVRGHIADGEALRQAGVAALRRIGA